MWSHQPLLYKEERKPQKSVSPWFLVLNVKTICRLECKIADLVNPINFIMQVQHIINAISSHLFNGLSNWINIKSKTELESDVKGFYWESVGEKGNNTEFFNEKAKARNKFDAFHKPLIRFNFTELICAISLNCSQRCLIYQVLPSRYARAFNTTLLKASEFKQIWPWIRWLGIVSDWRLLSHFSCPFDPSSD